MNNTLSMKTKAALPDVLHYDATRPCCETPSAGDFFPDLLRIQLNHLNRGRVFAVLTESHGVGLQNREMIVDQAAWDECVKSPNFRACYDLSMAKLALQQALA